MKAVMRLLVLCAFVLVFVVISAPAANAQIPETSYLRLTEPMNVGGTLLEPGVYVIRVLPLTNRNVLQVTNEDRSKVFATVLSIPHGLSPATVQANTEYVLYPAVAGSPRALRTWFARDPVSGGGHDIVYPEGRAMELAALAKEPVVAYKDETKVEELNTAQLEVVTPEKVVRPYVEPMPAPKMAMMSSSSSSTDMPKTASHVPLFAGLGVLLLGAALGIRALRPV